MQLSVLQAAVVSILLYGCTTWTQTKRLEKLDGNYTRMLLSILNKSTRHQLYDHLPPITKTIQVRQQQTCRTLLEKQGRASKRCTPMDSTYGRAKAGRPARTYIQQLCENSDVALKTSQRRWAIGRSGERGSRISMLTARHDDDDDGTIYPTPPLGQDMTQGQFLSGV